jgi:hypothetical protein
VLKILDTSDPLSFACLRYSVAFKVKSKCYFFFFLINIALQSVKFASCVQLKFADIEFSGFPSASVCLDEDLQADVWARKKKKFSALW